MTVDDAPARLFFAIMPDDRVRERLVDLAHRTAGTTGGRASAPDTLHLTVVFVGTVNGDAIPAIRDAGEAMPRESFALSVDALGSFARAGIAWAAPTRMPDALGRMNRDLVQALAGRGIATEARPYRPHVTLARRCERPIAATIDPPIAWSADAVVLMSSRLLSDGPRYRPVARWELRPAEAGPASI